MTAACRKSPNTATPQSSKHSQVRYGHSRQIDTLPTRPQCPLLFSNRPIEVKRFQTIRRHGVNVARGLALLFGFGTKALPSWDSRIRRNNLYRGLAVT
jgi:hypothetical protein